MYLKSILKSVVLSWLQKKKIFVLKEDDDSDHDTRKSNIVRRWKKQNDLNYYFNCSSSSNLSSIENCWFILKQYVRKMPHWDDATLRELIIEEWSQISENYINNQIDSMSERLQTVIDDDEKMTDYWIDCIYLDFVE